MGPNPSTATASLSDLPTITYNFPKKEKLYVETLDTRPDMVVGTLLELAHALG